MASSKTSRRRYRTSYSHSEGALAFTKHGRVLEQANYGGHTKKVAPKPKG